MRRAAFLAIALVALVGCERSAVTSPDAAVFEAATVGVTQISCVTGEVAVPINVRPAAAAGGNNVGRGRWLTVAIEPDPAEIVNIEDINLKDEVETGVDPTSVRFWACGKFSNALEPVHDLTKQTAFASHLKYDPVTEELLYLVFHFDLNDGVGSLDGESFDACLTGETQGGLTFAGCETVRVK